jgi:hypothetical protein
LSPGLQTTLQALLDSRPDSLKAYSLGTAFYRERKTGERKVSKIAVVEVKTGNLENLPLKYNISLKFTWSMA